MTKVKNVRTMAVALAPLPLLLACTRDPSSPTAVMEIRLAQPHLVLVSCDVQPLIVDVVAGVDADRRVTWASSRPEIAAVDGEGLVTAYAPGRTTISVASVADPRRVAHAVVDVESRSGWMELAGVEDASTGTRITTFVVRDSADVIARYSPSACTPSGISSDALTMVVTTRTAVDLSSRGWQRTSPTSGVWIRDLPPDRDEPNGAFRSAEFRIRPASATPAGDAIYPNGTYTVTLRLRAPSGATNIGVNGYALLVDR